MLCFIGDRDDGEFDFGQNEFELPIKHLHSAK